MSDHLMLVPSLDCPAKCKYCFGPNSGGAVMDIDTVEHVIEWENNRERNESLEITFHGGEPLIAGPAFYSQALEMLSREFSHRKVRFSIQSNLWNLDDDLCALFKEYEVSLGTSLDGPERINDAQRGTGYFKRTMKGIELARSHGLGVGCICTFTSASKDSAEEILNFFIGEGLDFTIHVAHPSLREDEKARLQDDWVLSLEEYRSLMEVLIARYYENMDRMRISNLDQMAKSISAGHGGICTFTDCLGDFLAVGPEGEIYPCQRFAGISEYVIGNVQSHDAHEEMKTSGPWKMLEDREERIEKECEGCSSFKYCRGGCPYNALASGKARANGLRDPYCQGYQSTFGKLTDLALDEVFSSENMEEVVKSAASEGSLLQRGKLITMINGGPHPRDVRSYALRVIAAAGLGQTGSTSETVLLLDNLGILSNREKAAFEIERLHQSLLSTELSLNNLYLHVTFNCNLSCTHCYARAESNVADSELSTDEVIDACRKAKAFGFRHAVITGGEPLCHSRREHLLESLGAVRKELKPLLTVLRTNLAFGEDDHLLQMLAECTDEVVVSIDGDESTHDERRGEGSYERTTENLLKLMRLKPLSDISIATVLPFDLVSGAPGESVRKLAKDLGIRRIRFRPLLPLGRAKDAKLDIIPEALWGHLSPREMIEYGFAPVSGCGIGHNLYIEPDGDAFPCYAWKGESSFLGSVREDGGLEAVIAGDKFNDLRMHNVDTNKKCRACSLRYLCGGACRAWVHESDDEDIDKAPNSCSHLETRARTLMTGALEHAGISMSEWGRGVS